MSMKIVKDWARVMYRAGVPGFIVGFHGIGKTSAIYQLFAETADEAGHKALPEAAVSKALVESKVIEAEIVDEHDGESVDERVLSSLDGKYLARAHEDLDTFGFWSMSAPNISIEEIIGMPHVDDRGAAYREAWYRSQDAAATLLANTYSGDDDFESMQEALQELTNRIFAGNCKRLGITEDDKNHIVLRYLRMHALMPDPRHRAGGIWLIDELNRGFQEVEKAMMQILLERRYLDYVVPDGVWICTTMNPPGGDYQVREMDAATLDRGAVITVKSDREAWLDWATKRGLSEGSRVFVEKHDGKLVNVAEKQAEFTIDNPATYRSIEWADKAYAVMTADEIKHVGQIVANSILGNEAGPMYHKEATTKVHRPLTAKEVLDGYGWKKDMDAEKLEKFETWTVTKPRARLAAMVKKENVKTELLRVTLAELQEWVKTLDKDLEKRGSTKNNPKHTPEERGQILNLLLFLYDIPADLARKFIQDDIEDLFFRTMYFTGKYPICKAVFDKIETQYKNMQKEAS